MTTVKFFVERKPYHPHGEWEVLPEPSEKLIDAKKRYDKIRVDTYERRITSRRQNRADGSILKEWWFERRL